MWRSSFLVKLQAWMHIASKWTPLQIFFQRFNIDFKNAVLSPHAPPMYWLNSPWMFSTLVENTGYAKYVKLFFKVFNQGTSLSLFVWWHGGRKYNEKNDTGMGEGGLKFGIFAVTSKVGTPPSLPLLKGVGPSKNWVTWKYQTFC